MDKYKLLEEAKRKYPIGTKFKCANGNHGNISDSEGNSNYKDGLWEVINYKYYNGGIHSGNGWITLNSKWAEIVEEKSEFKKDDYIVFTNVQSETKGFPVNFIFKQRTDDSYLRPYLDGKGLDWNGWEYHRNFNKNYKGYKTDWRYATKEEIAEYDRLGKPYDVTLLNKKEKIPDYVECIEEVKSCYGKLGLIYIVLGENHHGSDYNIKGSTSGSVSKKRFKPSTKEAYEKQNQKEEIQYYEILKESSGYEKGDIGKKIKNEYDGIILFVPNRKSISAYNPNVWFSFDNVRSSTEQAFLDQHQEDICDKCKDQFFDGSVNTGPHNLCEGSKCNEAQESYLDDLPIEDLPVISIDEFKLPEKWYVEVMLKDVEEYLLQKYGIINSYITNVYEHSKFYLYSEDADFSTPRYVSTGMIDKKFTKITLEQFKKYVLKTIRPRLKIGDTIEDDLFGIGTIISFDNDYFKVDKWSKKLYDNGKFHYNSDIAINAKIITKTEEWIPKEGEWITWINNSNKQNTYKLSKYISQYEWSVEYNGKNTDYKINIFTTVRKAEPYEIPKESIDKLIIYQEINKEVKKGDKLYCVESIIMNTSSPYNAAIEDKTYIGDGINCFINEKGDRHFLSKEFVKKHFRFIEEVDYVGVIDPATLDDPLIGGRPDFSNYDASNVIITGTRGFNKTFHQEEWAKQYYQQHPLRIEDCFIPKRWDPINSIGQGLWSQIEMPKKDISIERIEPITDSTNPTEFKWELMNFNQGTQSITQSIERIEPIAPSSLKIIK